MTIGDIVIASFPYSDLVKFKARPAVVVSITPDHYKDVIVCLITSVVPATINSQQILIHPSPINNLKVSSVIKVYRIATIERTKVLAGIGRLTENELQSFIEKFKSLVSA